jgi:hypothetical protein
MVNNQLGELLNRDVLFVAPDQGQSNSSERSENMHIAVPFGVERKVMKVLGMEFCALHYE